MSKRETFKAVLPFAGFYCSLFYGEIDNCVDLEVERLQEENETLSRDDAWSTIYRHIDYRAVHETVVPKYVDAFSEWISEQYGIAVSLKFKYLIAPREYNFSTDRIFVDVSRGDIAKLLRAVRGEKLNNAARKLFTSRSGFISHYSHHVAEWGKVDEWDHNQLLAVFTAITDGAEDFDLYMLHAMHEDVYAAVSDAIDWRAVETDVDILLARGEVDECREYPHRAINVAQYVEEFIKANHYK